MATVVIPVYGKLHLTMECIRRVVEHTSLRHQILVIDDATPISEGCLETLIRWSSFKDRVRLVRNDRNLGFPAVVNLGIDLGGYDDVVLVNSDVYVEADWLERLISEASRSDLVATVTAMTNSGSVATVSLDSEELSSDTLDELSRVNDQLGQTAVLPQAVIPVGVGHCMLIKRRAITVVGKFSEEFSPGYGEEADFSMRAVQHGFINVLATNVLVWHLGSQSFGDRSAQLRVDHERILWSKYKGYSRYVDTDQSCSGVIEAAFTRVFLLLRKLRVLVDLSDFNSTKTGSSVAALQYTSALVNQLGQDSVTIVGREEGMNDFPEFLQGIRLLSPSKVQQHVKETSRFDVLFRPGQVSSRFELRRMWEWARRVAILQLDYISFDNWSYHGSQALYEEFRNVTQAANLLSDSMMYLSPAILSESHRVSARVPRLSDGVIGCGSDHVEPLKLPSRVDERDRRVLVIGTAFAHKNRSYVLQLVRELDRQGCSPIHVDMVGAEPTFGGTSLQAELEILRSSTSSTVTFESWCADDRLREYLDQARVVLYPSVSEGFGLVPYEAARAGAAPLFAPVSSMANLLPNPPYALNFTDVAVDALVLEELLSDPVASQNQIDYVLNQGEYLTWEIAGTKLREFLEQTAVSPLAVPITVRKWVLGVSDKGSVVIRMRRLRNTSLAVWLFPPGAHRTIFVKRLFLGVFG